MRMNMTADMISFFMSVLSGIICGIVYDVFRVLRWLPAGKRLVSLFDFVFLTISAFVVTAVFYIYNECSLRLYMIVGVIIGSVLYFMILSRLIIAVLKKIIEIIKFFFKILLTPIVFLYKILLAYVFKPLGKLIKRIYLVFYNKIKRVRGKITHEKRRSKQRKKTKQNENVKRNRHYRRRLYADKGSVNAAADHKKPG